MGKLFNYDSPIMQTLNKIVDCFFLSVLWIVFSLPLVTFGASTTALYYTINKVIRHDRSSLWKEFWGAFKSNFKQSTIVWLILCVVYYIMITDCVIMYNFYKSGASVALFIVFAIMVLVTMMWTGYLFPCIARFENTTKNLMKTCALLMIRHILKSILLMLLLAVAIAGLIVMPVLIVIIPSVYMLVASFILESIFEKYMSPEDLEAEKERNQIYY